MVVYLHSVVWLLGRTLRLLRVDDDCRVLDFRLLPGNHNRREGGQGVVVFATSILSSDNLAIKMFVSQRHFIEERNTYENTALAALLPNVRIPPNVELGHPEIVNTPSQVMLLLAYSVPSFGECYTFILTLDKYLLFIHLIMRLHRPHVIPWPLQVLVVDTEAALVQRPWDATSVTPILSERYFKYRTRLLDITLTFVASYGP